MTAFDRKSPDKSRDRAERREARALSLGIELHAAAFSGHVGWIQQLLQHGANVEAPSALDGRHPLHTAAQGGRIAAIDALLQAGANPNARDRHGMTPLHRAAVNGHAAAVDALVSAGSDTAARDSAARTPLDLLPGNAPAYLRDLCRPRASK